jgi:aryl-alcohol dehydrogenase-like predicted oxidoreductase
VKYKNLGQSGLSLSLVGLGCNTFGAPLDVEATRKVVHRALDLGITFFDTADSYGNMGGSEEQLGRILGERRKDIVLATKFGNPMTKAGVYPGASRRYMMSAVEASLRRLKTDWIDLYQIHRPDPQTPIEETLRALDDLVRQGKVRYIGCSNFAAWQYVDAHWTARHDGLAPMVSCQDHYNLLHREIERDMLPAMAACGAGLLPYAPLSAGLLTGKYRRGTAPPVDARLIRQPAGAKKYGGDAKQAIADALQDYCESRGHTLLELAFSWLAAQPLVASVMAGVSRPEQLDANVAAIGWILTSDESADVDRISLGGS